ncbi:2-C-methyl-D-erythritol 4-phosphate cytidylyltransferase [Reichenbachiella sp.]
MKNYAVIVAGGSGSRMQASQPKQFLELDGKPILMHTLEAFANCRLDMHIILVLPADHIDTWQKLVSLLQFKTAHQITLGGTTRFDSVQNGLNEIKGNGIVAIHDGARPLVSSDIIHRTVDQAKKSGNGIAAVQVKDSIRQIKDGQSQAVDRNQFYSVQTPQTFDVDLIKKAFNQSQSNQFTDDASVIEAFGEKVNLVEGSYDNLKITTPEDLIIADSILKRRK